MDIEKLLAKAEGDTEEGRLGMILSNRIDFFDGKNCAISAKNFKLLIDDLLYWRNLS